MAIVQSSGQLEAIDRAFAPTYGALTLYDGLTQDYATLYRTQPNVRVVVDFLARNIAQIGLKVYRRVSRTEREELFDHDLAVTLRRPAGGVSRRTGFTLLRDTVSAIGIYGEAFWIKVRPAGGGSSLALVPWSPAAVDIRGENPLRADGFTLRGNRGTIELDAAQVVQFAYYNPNDARRGLSPLETLRRVLAEEAAAGEYREWFWKNAARREGVIERPLESPKWSDDARARFRNDWQAKHAGARGSGMTPILEEGMTWRDTSFSARDSQYLEARKLTREEVAVAYHIPPPMVGLLDRATFSNIEEQHTMLYQDTLGPWLEFLEQAIEEQLLEDFSDTENVFVEFNIAEKLKGSFEEQTKALQASVGRPYMTADEARARLNLPALGGDAENLVTPLNVIVGGQASPQDSVPESRGLAALPSGSAKARTASDQGAVANRRSASLVAHTDAMIAAFERQRRAVMSRLGAGVAPVEAFEVDRFNAELRDDLLALAEPLAAALGESAFLEVERLKGRPAAGRKAFDPSRIANWLRENSRIAAALINGTTVRGLEAATDAASASSVFDLAVNVRAFQVAQSRVTTVANFARTAGAEAGGAREKVWLVTSSSPRASHAAIDGEAVPFGELFSNGGNWPGDPALPVSERAGCTCLVEFGV